MTDRKLHTLPSSYNTKIGKASVFAPLQGSVTVEASLAVPIFFFAVLCLIFLFEVIAIQVSIRSGLAYAGKAVMEEAYPVSVVTPGKIEEYMVEAIGNDRLDRSIITGGSSGLDCSESRMSLTTGIGNLVVEYQIRIPVPLFYKSGIHRQDSIRIKAWTGYEKSFSGSGDDQTVYITETGLVYHKDYHCTYLDLSIQMVLRDSVDNLRNCDGGKYYPCRLCGGGNANQVYLTDSGNKYHGSLSCSGLKRTVYAVSLSEVIGKGACTRCGR